MKRLQLLFILATIASVAWGQKMKTVEAEYTYHAPSHESKEEACLKALNHARTKALADAFGTLISEHNILRQGNSNGESHSEFSSVGESEVKGEWIETIGEPKYDIRYVDDALIITCRVKGRAREIVSAGVDVVAKVLRNGTEDRFEDNDFRSGDDLYLSFTSPVGGYLAVYLVDAENQAFCLLPYMGQSDGIYPIVAGQPYVFFSMKDAPAEVRPYVNEYVMTSDRPVEHNQIFVIFSPGQFTKAADSGIDEGLPRQLAFSDFNKWLVRCRKMDKEMVVKIFPITIKRE